MIRIKYSEDNHKINKHKWGLGIKFLIDKVIRKSRFYDTE